jgi:Spy/CpxP family protein refolding chaperone
VSPWKVILATMVIFACGVITGGVFTRTMVVKTDSSVPSSNVITSVAATNSNSTSNSISGTTNRNPMVAPVMQMQRAEFLKRLEKQLDLTPAQHDEVAKIMRASQDRTQPLGNEIAPQMNDELKRVRDEIREVLTPEQRRKYQEALRKARKQDAVAPATNRFRAD